MVIYNLTNLTTAVNVGDQIKYLNSLSDGIFAPAMLVCIGLILFMAMKRYDKDFKECFVVSSAITTIIGFPMFAYGIMTWKPMGLCILILLSSLLVYKFTD